MDTTVLAKIGTKTVTEPELQEAIATVKQRNPQVDESKLRDNVLEQLIANKLMLLDAEKNLLEYDPQFKAEMKRVKEDMLVRFCLAKTLESVKAPTDDEIKTFYEANKERFKQGKAVNASHILVKTAEEAVSIMNDIKDNKISFEDAARKYSSCPSKDNGGNLGEFTRGQMVKEFDEAVFNMNVGDITGPVQTQFGFHIIKLNGVTEEKTFAMEDIKNDLVKMIMQDKQQKAYVSKINQLKILYPVDKF